MRHRKKTLKLNRTASHRRALLANLVSSLIREEKLKTTLPKAKAAQPRADKMITLAKQGTLAARRRAVQFLQDPEAVKKLFSEVGPRFTEREGGYTRILKLANPRRGDGAMMAQLSLVELGGGGKASAGTKKEKKQEKQEKPPPPPPDQADEQG